MTETVTRPGVTGELLYAEDKCGLERKMIIQAIAAPVIFLVLLVPLAFAGSNAEVATLLVPTLFAGFWTMLAEVSLIFIWPVGIRVDSAGIRIGGLRGWEKRQLSGRWPPRKPFRVAAEGRAVFTCPWDGVHELYLVHNRDDVKPLLQQKRAFRKRTSQTRTPLGFFGIVNAGLVVVNDPARTSSDPATFRSNRSQTGPIKGVVSPTWLVPTRHPDALLAALAQAPVAPPVQDRLPPDERFSFYSPR